MGRAMPRKIKVPLVDRTGESPRTIGEAEVYLAEHGDNVDWSRVEVTANITNPAIIEALRPKMTAFSIFTGECPIPDTFKK